MRSMTPDLVADLLAGSLAANPCCGNEQWRGRLCQYHQGYEDGLEAMEAFLAIADATVQP